MLSRLWHMLRSHLDSASEWHAAYMREHDEHLATQGQLDDALALLSDTQDRAAIAAGKAAEWQARAEHAEALLHGRAVGDEGSAEGSAVGWDGNGAPTTEHPSDERPAQLPCGCDLHVSPKVLGEWGAALRRLNGSEVE